MKHLEIARTLGLEEQLQLGQILFEDFDTVELCELIKKMNFSFKKEKSIQRKWEKHLLSHDKDFDGSLGSIFDMYKYKKTILRIKFRKAKFSQFLGTQEDRPLRINLRKFPMDKEICLPLSIGAIAITNPTPDHTKGCMLFAERAKTAFDENVMTLLPGGYFDPSKDFFIGENEKNLERKYSIVLTLLRELFEETGIILSNVKINYLGMIYNSYGSKQPLIACYVNIPYPDKLIMDKETKRIYFVDNDIEAVKEFIKGKKLAWHDALKLILYFNKM